MYYVLNTLTFEKKLTKIYVAFCFELKNVDSKYLFH